MLSTLIFFFILAICASFLCSLWESVLLSITPSYSQLQEQSGSEIGKRLQEFKKDVDRPLAAILTLNTIAHTVGAIGVGEQATMIWHDSNPLITGLLVPAGMTLAILLLSEIIPKTLGANYWKEFAPFTVYSLTVIIFLLWPAVWLSEKLTRLLRKNKEGSVFSRSEFLALTEIGAEHGVIEKHESRLIRSMLKFQALQVQDIMTPRIVVKRASQDLELKEYLEKHSDFHFSRIPIYEADNSEKITGYIRKDELLHSVITREEGTTLKELRRDIIVVLPNFPITDLLNIFLEKREHIALVVDEFGGLSGIVTMEDLIETLLGLEIVDELDNVEDMQKLARQRWQKRAKAMGLNTDEIE